MVCKSELQEFYLIPCSVVVNITRIEIKLKTIIGLH